MFFKTSFFIAIKSIFIQINSIFNFSKHNSKNALNSMIMYARLLFCLLQIFILTLAQGQDAPSPEALAEAQKNVEEKKKLFSTEHINYVHAALDLAKLYYYDEYTEEEGDSLAYPAMRFVHNEYGSSSPEYQNALKRIPNKYAILIDANIDLDEALTKHGKKSPYYAQKLIKKGMALAMIEDYDVHTVCLEAYQILAQYPYKENKTIYEYAEAHIEHVVLDVVKSEIEVRQVKKEAPNSIKHANALVKFARVSIKHEDHDLLYVKIDNNYLQIKKALGIYKETVGKNSKQYTAAIQAFSPEMKEFYPLEKEMLERIKLEKAPDDQFVTDLITFLKAVGEVYFLKYYEDDIFKKVLKNIETKHDKSNKYYAIIQAIQSRWDMDESEENLLSKKAQADAIKAEFGEYSEPYANALIEMTNEGLDNTPDKDIIVQYMKAFKILQDLEVDIFLETNEDAKLIQKYLAKVVKPWDHYIVSEQNIETKRSLFGDSHESYVSALFETGIDYMTREDLYTKGENYFIMGLKRLTPVNSYLAIEWLDSLFRLDPENISYVAPNLLAKKLTVHQLEILLERPLAAIQQKYGEHSVEYGNNLEVLADGHFFSSNPGSETKSLQLYQQILAIYKDKEGLDYSYLDLLNKITQNLQDRDHWTIEDGVFCFEEQIKILERQQSSPKVLLKKLRAYANWHYKHERIIAAEPIYKRLIQIYEKGHSKDKNTSEYAHSLYHLARIFRKTGRYGSANQYYKKAIDVARITVDYALMVRCLDDIGLLLHKVKLYDTALESFKIALELFEQIEKYLPDQDRYSSLENGLQYIKILRHIGRVHLDKGDIDNAERHYNRVIDFEKEEASPVSFEKDISLQRDLGLLAAELDEDEKAERYFKYAIDNLQDKDEIADANILFANYYKSRERDSLAAVHFLHALQVDLKQIETNYSNLSEKERLLFLDPISKRFNLFFDFAVRYPDSTMTITALNAHLGIKGLALETSTNIQSICYATENVLLRKDCYQMQLLRKKLSKSASLSTAEQDSINATILELEKKISLSSQELREVFGRQNKKLDFAQLQQILLALETPDSAAIAVDFLVINEQNHYGEQLPIYYAIIIDPHKNTPQFIRLASEDELEDVLGTDVAPNTINYITDELESQYLYQLVWEPILPFIQHAKRLELCPTGILSRIAFGTLLTNDFSNERIMDLWSLHYYSSLRDLLNPQVDEEIKEADNIGLIGGVKFTFSPEETKNLALSRGINPELVEEGLTAKKTTSSFGQSRGARGEDFNYLPGTLQEINAISKLFINNEWVVKHLSDTLATEENVTILTDESPSILHIATHGFFFSTPKEEDGQSIEKTKSKDESLEHKIAHLDNPLLRSGLALADINRVWKGGKEIEGLEDGILTALEVANMDLFNTKLVVLSACETGRGDIDNNEGIMGLQRAFKTAGAKQLIISLWKVPDAQTSELMQLFYQQYLSGKTAHAAFENAQHIMRRRYRNPYYWAAFLLIE